MVSHSRSNDFKHFIDHFSKIQNFENSYKCITQYQRCTKLMKKIRSWWKWFTHIYIVNYNHRYIYYHLTFLLESRSDVPRPEKGVKSSTPKSCGTENTHYSISALCTSFFKRIESRTYIFLLNRFRMAEKL